MSDNKTKPKAPSAAPRRSLQSGGETGSERLSSRSRRTRTDASRRAMEARADVESAIHVLDNGVDRTPLPLQRAPANAPQHRHDDGGSNASMMHADSSSLFQSSMLESSPVHFGMGLNSVLSPSSPSQGGMEQSVSSFVNGSAERGNSVTSSSPYSGSHGFLPSLGSVQLQREDVAAAAQPRTFSREERRAWLETKTTVVISETPTIMLYTHQDEIVSSEKKKEVDKVLERNNVYASIVESKRVDEGTRFQQKGVWTFSVPKKSIHCSIQPPHRKNAGALQVTTWMLRDEFAALNANDPDEEEDKESDEEDEEEEGELVENVSDNGKDDGSEGTGVQSSRGLSRSAVSWMFSSSLLSNLRVMERAIVQNNMEELQLSYRGIKMDPKARRVPIEENEAEETNVTENAGDSITPTETAQAASGGEGQSAGEAQATATGKEVPPLKLSEDIVALWTFRSPFTQSRSVTCMAWNCKETDILAVGYSVPRASHALENDDTPGGIVCCWSLKNPLAPERVIRLSSETGVSSLAFSFEYPSLLAVGDTEGGIAVYGVQRDSSVPAIKTAGTGGQHTGAVWDLKWVAGGKERGEFLMSISGDGRVVQWSVGKTIERIAPDLMTLKRQHGAVSESAFARSANMAALNSNGAAGTDKRGKKQQKPQKKAAPAMPRKTDALLSRQCGGMCLDVSPADGTIYIVGTEDGYIHQCNKSQTENYELDYAPHSELVYRVRWSPFSDWYFLTCSADWSSRLYRFGEPKQLVTFDSPNQDAVQDVAWSYTNSTIFATVTAQGSAEFWSIVDSIHPRSRAQFLDNRRLSSLLFAEQDAAVVIIGDEKGDVTAFRLLAPCYGTQNMMADEQEQALEEAIRKATS